MDEQAQVVIPDLDDESLLHDLDVPVPRLTDSPGGSYAEHVPSAVPLDEAPSLRTRSDGGRLRHFRSGSLTGDESASVSTKGSFKFGSPFSHAASHTDRHTSPSRAHDRAEWAPAFHFPVKKSSFASLRAAIKGQPTTPSAAARDHDAALSPFFSESESMASRRLPRTMTLGDITSVSTGLAQATGMARAARRHAPSSSQASLSPETAAPTSSPSRLRRARHAHHGSQLSEPSWDAHGTSPSSAALDSLLALAPDAGAALPWAAKPMTFAARQVLLRFQGLADEALYAVMTAQQDAEVTSIMYPSPGHRNAWADMLDVMTHVAQYDRALLQDALLAWRADVLDQPLPSRLLQRRPSDSSLGAPGAVYSDVLRRRRALASTYLAGRALMATVPPGISDTMGSEADDEPPHEFVTTVFQFLHLCSVDRDSERGAHPRLQVTLQQQCFDTVARLLGALSRHCMPALGEQFVSILHESSAVAASRDNELLTEAAILGMRYLHVAIYPMQAFEAGAQVLQQLARYFAQAHGYRIKRAFAKVLHALIEPVARQASAELHHPAWVSAMQVLLGRALSMLQRSRYWSVAFSLCTVVLCASPPDVFLERWFALIEAGHARLRERPRDLDTRVPLKRCSAQLLWTYLFRCHEGTNPTQRRLEAFWALGLPPPRAATAVYDPETDACVAMLSAALYRQLDLTRPVVLELLCHAQLDRKTAVFQREMLQPTRMSLAIRAVMAALHCYVSGEPPALPGADAVPTDTLAADPGAPISFPSAEASAAFTQFISVLTHIAVVCDYLVKDLSVADERVPIARGAQAPLVHGERTTLDPEHYEVRSHAGAAFTVAYAREQQPYLDLLRTCLDTWPRGLAPTMSAPTCYTLLFRALYSVDPAVQRASAAALRRFARAQGGAPPVLRAFLQWMYRQDGVVWELQAHADLLLSAVAQTTQLITDIVAMWGTQAVSDPDGRAEVEAGALMLLCLPSAPMRQHAVQVLGHLAAMAARHGAPPPCAATMMDDNCTLCLDADHPRLSAAERARVLKWTEAPSDAGSLARLAMSAEHAGLWMTALPRVLARVAAHAPGIAATLYTHLHGAVHRLEPSVAQLARLRRASGAKVPSTLHVLRTTWRAYALAMCATGHHSTQHVALLLPYLACEDADLQASAAEALAQVHDNAYPALVQALAAPGDERRARPTSSVALILAATSTHLPCAAVHATLVAWVHAMLPVVQAPTPDLEHFRTRRSVAVVLARLYPALDTAHADEAFPMDVRMRWLRLLHEWHLLHDAARLAAQLSAAVERSGDQPKERLMVQLRQELHGLASAASLAIEALCAGPLDAGPGQAAVLVPWLLEMLASPSAPSRDAGRRALSALLARNAAHAPLLHALLPSCFGALGDAMAERSPFTVLADAYAHHDLALAPHAALALALPQLGHNTLDVRTAALAMLAAWRERQPAPAAAPRLASFVASVRSALPSAYLRAQLSLSTSLARSPPVAPSMGARVVLAATQGMAHAPPAHHVLILRTLPAWVASLDADAWLLALPALLELTLLHHTEHPVEVSALWSSMEHPGACAPPVLDAIQVRCRHYGSLEFLAATRAAMASLPPDASAIVQRLCIAQLTPEAVAPSAAPASPLPPWALEAHLPPPGTELPALAPALVALLWLAESCQPDALGPDMLARLLHTLCLYADGAPTLLQPAVDRAAEQVLSALAPHASRAVATTAAWRAAFRMSRADQAQLNEARVPLKTQACADALCALGEAHAPGVHEAWRRAALQFATHAPVYRMACHSLQLARALRLPECVAQLPELLVRLADSLVSPHGMAYALESLATLQAWLPHAPPESRAPVFYAAAACAGSAMEPVFAAAVSLLHAWLEHAPDDADAGPRLVAARPAAWDASTPSLQWLVARGLRSSRWDHVALTFLVRWARWPPSAHVDSDATERVLGLLNSTLPWCMRACDTSDTRDPIIAQLGEALTAMAHQVQRPDIARVAHSIAHAKFRSADELARQAAACLAQGASTQRATAMVSDLLLTLNHEAEWVQRHSLTALPPLLQALHAYGNVLALTPPLPLDPLFRMLRTALAPLALDVMHQALLSDQEASGPPLPAGWAGLTSLADTERAHTNIRAVASEWQMPSGSAPPLAYAAEASGAAMHGPLAAPRSDAPQHELGLLASQLDDLALFFAQDTEPPPSPRSSHGQVAKILARSVYAPTEPPSRASPTPPEMEYPSPEPVTSLLPLYDRTMSDRSYDTTAPDASRLFGSGAERAFAMPRRSPPTDDGLPNADPVLELQTTPPSATVSLAPPAPWLASPPDPLAPPMPGSPAARSEDHTYASHGASVSPMHAAVPGMPHKLSG